MKPGGGKAKGSSFERLVCKALSLWVSHGAREDLFWRSAMSGGRATVGRRKGLDLAQHAGDISSTSPDGHKLTDIFFIECKFVKDLGVANFVYRKPSTIRRFLEIADLQSCSHNRETMLIAKENNGPIIVVLRSDIARQYDWAKESVIARIVWDDRSSVAVLDFNQMIGAKFNTRVLR